MPKSDSYSQGVQYPVLGDAPDIEVQLQTLVNGFVPRLVMRFADANARAAALTGTTKPVPGMITYLVAEDRWEGRQADNTWLLLSDGPWTPLTYSNGHGARAGSPGWRKKAGGGIELRGLIQSNGGKLNDGSEVIKFGAIPAAVAPGAIRHYIVPTNRTTTSGLTRMTARVQIGTAGDLTYFAESGAGQGTVASPGWFALDGIQFSPAGD
ncbi:hypothetical protein [Streptomyces sp. NPDC056291]|uniref:hypothetical protein n=1 Tax=Streptomyces sp. NPDC056291 TaxID=3345772 RepID=UPI0035D93AAB